MRRILLTLIVLAALGAGLFWLLTAPRRLPDDATAGLAGDAARGQAVFWAAGCASCHAAPGAQGDAQMVLTGGQRFDSAFGTFVAPNISPDPVQGIGGWSLQDFANAVQRGVSPQGAHYYPAFPYASYARAEVQDIADLKAFMDTLPADATPSQPHEVGFPFSIRRMLGGWKLLFMREGWVVEGPLDASETRGRYLAESLGHCSECHTPRNILGGSRVSRWLSGGPFPAGEGRFPNITPGALTWSADEIAEYLTSGFTPDFDSVGGKMALVVADFARLPASDRAAVAAYLKKVPPVE